MLFGKKYPYMRIFILNGFYYCVNCLSDIQDNLILNYELFSELKSLLILITDIKRSSVNRWIKLMSKFKYTYILYICNLPRLGISGQIFIIIVQLYNAISIYTNSSSLFVN